MYKFELLLRRIFYQGHVSFRKINNIMVHFDEMETRAGGALAPVFFLVFPMFVRVA